MVSFLFILLVRVFSSSRLANTSCVHEGSPSTAKEVTTTMAELSIQLNNLW